MRKILLTTVKYPERRGTESFQKSQLDLGDEDFTSSMIQITDRLLKILVPECTAHLTAHSQDWQEQYCPV